MAYDGSKAMQAEYRAQGAKFFEFAADPRTGHECGDSRYLSIRYFDFWLRHRLPNSGNTLRAISDADVSEWNSEMAPLQQEFIQTGAVSDTTPPPAPSHVRCKRLDNGSVEITWTATADFESGLSGFVILRNDEELASLPEKAVSRFGRPLFQGMSYHDTPEAPVPQMTLIDRSAPTDRLPQYSVISVNSVQIKSKATAADR